MGPRLLRPPLLRPPLPLPPLPLPPLLLPPLLLPPLPLPPLPLPPLLPLLPAPVFPAPLLLSPAEIHRLLLPVYVSYNSLTHCALTNLSYHIAPCHRPQSSCFVWPVGPVYIVCPALRPSSHHNQPT
jgi:hypothetical protein